MLESSSTKTIPIECQVFSQSVQLDIDMERQTIMGTTLLKANLQFPKAHLIIRREKGPTMVKVDFSQRIELRLNFKQIEILQVSVPDQSQIRLLEAQYLSHEAQANACKTQPALKYPVNQKAYVQLITQAQKVSQEMIIYLQYADQSQSKEVTMEWLMDLQQNLEFLVEIQYKSFQPIFGLRFIKHVRVKDDEVIKENYLITEKQLEGSRTIAPTPKASSDGKVSVFYGKFVLIVNEQYVPVCSGAMVETIVIEETKKQAYVFEINRKLDPEDVGIYVGPWQVTRVDNEINFFLLHRQPDVTSYFTGGEFKKLINQVESYWFKDLQMKPLCDERKLSNTGSVLNGSFIVVIPSIDSVVFRKVFKQYQYGPFENIIVVGESFFPQFKEQPCKHMAQQLHQNVLQQINYLILKRFIVYSNRYGCDAWVVEALAFQASETPDPQKKLIKMVQNGCDVVLDQSPFIPKQERGKAQPEEYDYPCYQLSSKDLEIRAQTVIQMLARLSLKTDRLVKEIIFRLYQQISEKIPKSDEGDQQITGAPSILLSSNLIYLSKKSFGIKSLGYFENQFIKSFGISKFKVAYSYHKTDHKLNFTISQVSLMKRWAETYSKNRVLQEVRSQMKSEVAEQYLKIQDKITQIKEKFNKMLKEKDEIFIEQIFDADEQRKPEIEQLQNERITERLERAQIPQTHAIVPQYIRAQLYFSGPVRVLVKETNELDLKEEDIIINVEAQAQVKTDQNCPQRIKKLNIPKRHQEINAASYLQTEELQKPGLLQNEATDNDTLVQNQMVHGIFSMALLNSAAQIQTVKQLGQKIQSNPPLWIKWDRMSFLLKQFESQNQDENTILCQVLKEKDMNHIENVLLTIKNSELRSQVLRLVIEIIETSYFHFQSQVLVQTIKVLGQMVSFKSKDLEKRELEDLNFYWKMIEKIMYRFFFNQNDNSLKYLEFSSNMDEYHVILSCLKSLKDLPSTQAIGFHDTLMHLVTSLLPWQDNSINLYSSDYLNGQLYALILKTNCGRYKYEVIDHILHRIRKEVVQNVPHKYVLYQVARHFQSFVKINFSENPAAKLGLPKINEVLEFLHEFRDIDQDIEVATFKASLYKEIESTAEPYQFILDLIYQLNYERVCKSHSIIFKAKLGFLSQFMRKNYEVFAQQLSVNDDKSPTAKKLAAALWSCLTTGPALIDHYVQYHYLSIYKTLYYYWSPIQYQQKVKESRFKGDENIHLHLCHFQFDHQWLTSEWNRLHEDQQKEKNFYGFKTKKRQKITKENQTIDPSISLQKFIARNQDKRNERDISFYVLKQISQLPEMRKISEEILRDKDKLKEENPQKFNLQLSKKFDTVKSNLKRKFDTMEDAQRQMIGVIDSFCEKQLITSVKRREYQALIEDYFTEASKILNDSTHFANVQLKAYQLGSHDDAVDLKENKIALKLQSTIKSQEME